MEDAAGAEAAMHDSEWSRVDDQQVQSGSGSRQEQGRLDDRIGRLHDDLIIPRLPTRQEQGSLANLISRLPDDVLGAIISFLPTKDGARTQVLSRRWLPLWRSNMAPLNLVVDSDLCSNPSRVAAVVSKILSDHPAPARRLSIHITPHRGFRAKVAPWFLSEKLTGLQELEVTNPRRKCYPLPRHALTRFAPTLRLLKLSGCRRLRELPSFPRLKQLILYDVGISDDSLQRMISSCAVLESLSLRSVRFGRLCISSQTLRSIDLHALRSKGLELLIEDAPCLERLLPDFPDDGLATIRVIRAPKLQILGFSCLRAYPHSTLELNLRM
jgi:hypothetical protein